MKFNFKIDVVVEAATVEDALSKIAGRIATVARHVGNGVELAVSKPFFALSPASDDAEAHNLAHDPVVAAAKQAEQDAARAEGEGERETLTAADVGTLDSTTLAK